MENQVVLEAHDLHKSFNFPKTLAILSGVSISVKQGETVAIMGRSGEGKSTLLHILGTLDAPSQGTLKILGQPVTFTSLNQIRSQYLGFVFQSFHLLEDFTILENVLMPAKIARKEALSHALSLIEQVGLKGRENQLVKQLSGGEKQRTAIARAFCNHPDIILADEPTGNLDRKTADEIHSLLLNMTRGQGKTLVVVTHNQELADLCDRTYHLQNGKLIPFPEN